MIKELTDTNFHQEVEKSEIPYIIDFWAIWCAPCSMVTPILEEIAKEYDGKVKVGKVNVDNEIKIANEHTIQNIPTIMIFSQGKEVERIIGAVPKDHIEKKLKKYISDK
ncbi:thioredoxin [candidate division WOR-3 bacterium]|jgi:thioredoxin 1|nr:thioredoxin [candidate division WOR-3 bacterium]